MLPLKTALFAGLLAGLAQAQDERRELPTACELRAYLLDADRKPASLKDTQAWVVFSAEDGKKVRYPMTLVKPAKDADRNMNVAWDVKDIEGTPYKIGLVSACTYKSPPGGNPATNTSKEFIRPLQVPVRPDDLPRTDKNDPLPNAPYYRTYLDQDEINDLSKHPYTDVHVVFSINDEKKSTKAWSCADATPVRPDSKK